MQPFRNRTRSVLVMLLAGCATSQPPSLPDGAPAQSGRFDFAVMGDAPYTVDEEARVAATLAQMNGSALAFVVHVGDIQADASSPYSSGARTCTDASLARRGELFALSEHPLILTPGDNDWTDCYRVPGGAVEPLERLARLRALFFADYLSLGRRRLRLAVQRGYPENRQWVHGGVRFATLHVVGSNNNRGRTPGTDDEYRARNAANLTWLADTFARAASERAPGVVLLIQANPRFEAWPPNASSGDSQPGADGFHDFLAALEKEVLRAARPVLLVHGDTHRFRIDKPLTARDTRRVVPHFTRLETFGSPDVHWVRVTVDASRPGLFAFAPEMVTAP